MKRLEPLANRLGIDQRALVGLVVLAGGTLLWVFAFVGGGFHSPIGQSKTTVKASFASIEHIVHNDPVRVNGVLVGRVSKAEQNPGGRGGTLTFEVDKSAGTIHKDAGASIVWRTVLGANEAVALDPGTPSSGPLGDATIPQSQTSNQVELDEVTQAVHGGAQPGVRTMLQQLGPAFSAHPALAHALSTLTQVAPSAKTGIGALRGEVRDVDLRNLVRNAGAAARALDVGTGGERTRRFVEGAAKTLTAPDMADLRTAIVRAARALHPSQVMFAHLDRILYRLDPLLPKLLRQAPRVAPTLRSLRPAVAHAHALLADADPLLRKLRPTVHSLERAARAGVPVLDEVAPSLDRLAKDILPGLARVYPEENLPVYKLIGPTIVGLGTLSNFVDQDGELANLTAGLEEPQSAQLLPCTLDFSGTNFLVCSTLSDALQSLFGGSSSLLEQLSQRPGGAKIYGPLLQNAQRVEARLAANKRALAKVRPNLAKWLFERHHGGTR